MHISLDTGLKHLLFSLQLGKNLLSPRPSVVPCPPPLPLQQQQQQAWCKQQSMDRESCRDRHRMVWTFFLAQFSFDLKITASVLDTCELHTMCYSEYVHMFIHVFVCTSAHIPANMCMCVHLVWWWGVCGDPVTKPCFPRLSHSSDFKLLTLVATLLVLWLMMVTDWCVWCD